MRRSTRPASGVRATSDPHACCSGCRLDDEEPAAGSPRGATGLGINADLVDYREAVQRSSSMVRRVVPAGDCKRQNSNQSSEQVRVADDLLAQGPCVLSIITPRYPSVRRHDEQAEPSSNQDGPTPWGKTEGGQERHSQWNHPNPMMAPRNWRAEQCDHRTDRHAGQPLVSKPKSATQPETDSRCCQNRYAPKYATRRRSQPDEHTVP